jgi:hypothetical protein
MEHSHAHTPTEITHNKEVHSFYMFVVLVVFGILILQPISMVFLIVAQSLLQ